MHAPPDFREACSGVVDRKARAGALKQADGKGFFERLDVTRDRRMRQSELAGALGQGACVGDGDE